MKNEVLGEHEEVRLGLPHSHTLSLWFLCQLQTGRAFSYTLPGGAQKHFRGSGEICFFISFILIIRDGTGQPFCTVQFAS